MDKNKQQPAKKNNDQSPNQKQQPQKQNPSSTKNPNQKKGF